MSSETLHEDAKTLGPQVVDRHRAITSLMEELEAVDWYDQRAAATSDDELRAILVHNRDEEKEHAAMVLEWLRRQDPKLDANLRKYLFTEEPLAAQIAEEKAEPPAPVAPEGHLGIGDLRSMNGNKSHAPQRRAANER
jgi:ferritin-like protein